MYTETDLMNSITATSFFEEFTKIAESFERSGRRPITVDRLLEREVEDSMTPSVKLAAPDRKHIMSALAGAAGFEVARRANEDRKLGRMVRKQQQQ